MSKNSTATPGEGSTFPAKINHSWPNHPGDDTRLTVQLPIRLLKEYKKLIELGCWFSYNWVPDNKPLRVEILQPKEGDWETEACLDTLDCTEAKTEADIPQAMIKLLESEEWEYNAEHPEEDEPDSEPEEDPEPDPEDEAIRAAEEAAEDAAISAAEEAAEDPENKP